MNKNILFSLMLTSMSLASEYNPDAYLLLDDELSPYALNTNVIHASFDKGEYNVNSRINAYVYGFSTYSETNRVSGVEISSVNDDSIYTYNPYFGLGINPDHFHVTEYSGNKYHESTYYFPTHTLDNKYTEYYLPNPDHIIISNDDWSKDDQHITGSLRVNHLFAGSIDGHGEYGDLAFIDDYDGLDIFSYKYPWIGMDFRLSVEDDRDNPSINKIFITYNNLINGITNNYAKYDFPKFIDNQHHILATEDYVSNNYLDGTYSNNRGTFTATPNIVKVTDTIEATKHGLIGPSDGDDKVDFSTGGKENFAVGHSHKFYGKESFAVHDGNIVGSMGFYYKAIDTVNNLIYLSPTQMVFDLRCGSLTGERYNASATYPEYNTPYFGDPSESAKSELFIADPSLGLTSELVGKEINIRNCFHDEYQRCFRVVEVINGSVIRYTELKSVPTRTVYRKSWNEGSSKYTYQDNEYLITFPDLPKVTCNSGVNATTAAFGNTAIGDGNTVIGYNSTAIGKSNKALGDYSIALGLQSIAKDQRSFVWNPTSVDYNSHGNNTFSINPAGGVNGFYIGDQNLGTIIGNNSVQPYDPNTNPNGYLTKDDFINLLDEAMTTGIRVGDKIYKVVSQDYVGD